MKDWVDLGCNVDQGETTVRDNQDGTYVITWVPRNHGKKKVVVSVNDVDVKDVEVTVRPTLDGKSCIAFGDGLTKAEVGTSAEFTIETRNPQQRQTYNSGKTTFCVLPYQCSSEAVVLVTVIHVESNSEAVSHVDDHRNGSYTATYTASREGAHSIHVTVDGTEIHKSPFSVNAIDKGTECCCFHNDLLLISLIVAPAVAVLTAAQYAAYGPGLQSPTEDKQTHFIIEPRDQNGNKLAQKGWCLQTHYQNGYSIADAHSMLLLM
jgi:hypothetical protein